MATVRGSAVRRAVAAAMAAVALMTALAFLQTPQAHAAEGSLEPGTYAVTANLAMPGEYNPVLSGVTVYANSPDNPFDHLDGTPGPVLDGNDPAGVEKAVPMAPESGNATLVVGADGARTLVLPIENPVFTTQELGVCPGLSNVRTERTYPADPDLWTYGNRESRICLVSAELTDDAAPDGKASYVFAGSVLYAVPLDLELRPSGDVALELTVDYATAVRVSDSTDVPAVGDDDDPSRPEGDPTCGFTDVAEHWVVTEGWLSRVVDAGYMGGYGGTTLFGPDDVLSRGQAATILYRFANPDSTDTTNPDDYASSTGRFKDLPTIFYYNAAVEWCADAGVIGGYVDPATGEPNGMFGPDDPVTREQLAKMVAGLAWHLGADHDFDNAVLDAFSDADKAGAWAVEGGYLAWCVENGLFGGNGATGELDPTGSATRAMMAKLVTVLSEIVG